MKKHDILAIERPDLIKEWHPTLNKDVTPYDVTAGSDLRVAWICSHGHVWWTTVRKRAVQGTNCPVCENRVLLKGYNDLATTHPHVAEEWNSDKNGTLSPSDFFAGSVYKAWWTCSICGKTWQARIDNRTRGVGCPHCAHEHQTSFPEQAILYYVNKCITALNRSKVHGYELDVYIPSLKIGIEYNGLHYHKDREEIDNRKLSLLKNAGVHVIVVAEGNVCKLNADTINYTPTSGYTNLDGVIVKLLAKIGFNDVDIDLKRDCGAIHSQYVSSCKDNSLAFAYPDVAKDWDLELNKGLTPDQVSRKSTKMAWWRCSTCGWVWAARIDNRAGGKGCPLCSNRVVKQGHNDLATTHRHLMEDWDFEKNIDISPYNVTAGSSKSALWKCSECSHEWRATIKNRSRGQGCPICARERGKQKRVCLKYARSAQEVA